LRSCTVVSSDLQKPQAQKLKRQACTWTKVSKQLEMLNIAETLQNRQNNHTFQILNFLGEDWRERQEGWKEKGGEEKEGKEKGK